MRMFLEGSVRASRRDYSECLPAGVWLLCCAYSNMRKRYGVLAWFHSCTSQVMPM